MHALADNCTTFPAAPRQLRRVRGYYRLFQQHVMLLVVFLFATAFWTIDSGLVKLYFCSVKLPGQVSRTWTTPGPGGMSHFIAVAYRFEGTDYEQELSVADPEAARFPQGAAVPLLLLPERPDRPQLDRANYPHGFVTMLGVLMAAAPWICVLRLLWLLYVEPWRLRQLLRHGATASGTITERKELPGRPATYVLTYDFKPLTVTGAPVQARMPVERDDYQATAVGDPVLVVYDPEHPRRSVLYRYADYQVIGAAPAALRHPIPCRLRLQTLHWITIVVATGVWLLVIGWLVGWWA